MRTRALAWVMVVAGLVVPAVDAGAVKPPKPRAELTVAAVGAPTSATTGTPVTVTVKVRNAGKTKAGRTTTSLLLSTDRTPGRDVALKPTLATPAIKGRKAWSGRVRVTVPASTVPGTYHLIACADATKKVKEGKEGDNCRASGAFAVTSSLSPHDLIESDVASGRITEEQGLTYRVFSDFGDPRLPGRYAGRGNGLDEGALEQAADAWDDLGPEAQAVLRPFLVPPMYAGSHWTPAQPPLAPTSGSAPARRALQDKPWCSGNDETAPVYALWDYVDTDDSSVRIWWQEKHPGDAATAAHLRGVLDTALPALTALMGRGPKSDAAGLCDGGSGALDIAIVAASTATTYADGPCGASGTSAHMVWPRTKPGAWAGSDPYLSHEVMHAIQFAMPVAGSCAQYSWLREMTAQWTQDFVTDPTYGVGLGPDDTEHLAAPTYLDNPEVSLDVVSPPSHHDYSTYLLAQWAARKGGASIVREIWDAAATQQPKQAIDAALPGGFEATWADFALSNWNQGPIDDYRQWDGLSRGAATVGAHTVPLRATTNPSIGVDHLAAKYLELRWAPGVKEIKVTNDKAGDKAGDKTARLRAVITYSDGTHEIQDLSEKEESYLCIGDGTRTAVSVTLVFSNADLGASTTFRPAFEGLDTCGCANAHPTGPDGARADGARTAASGPVCALANLSFQWSDTWTEDPDQERWSEGRSSGQGSVTLRLVPVPGSSGSFTNDPTSTYAVRQTGSSEHHTNGGCDESTTWENAGSGVLPEDAVGAGIWEETGELWFSSFLSMPTRFDNTHTNCGGTSTWGWDTALTTPECPPQPGVSDPFYEFQETAPGSRTYTFSCTGEAEYEDGSGRHRVTATVSGTLTLP